MIKWAKDYEKKLSGDEMVALKVSAASLARAYGLENKYYVWVVDLNGELYFVEHNPHDDADR